MGRDDPRAALIQFDQPRPRSARRCYVLNEAFFGRNVPMLIVDEQIRIPDDEFQFEFARAGGPGGQNVNKVASKAILRWNVVSSPSLPDAVRDRLVRRIASRLTTEGDLVISSQRTRDQGRNVADCLERVRLLVLAAARPPRPRIPTRPSAASKRRRAVEKSQRSERKRDRRPPALD